MGKSYEKARAEIAKQYNKELQAIKLENKNLKEENRRLQEKLQASVKQIENLQEQINMLNMVVGLSEEEKNTLIKSNKTISNLREIMGIIGVNNKMLITSLIE